MSNYHKKAIDVLDSGIDRGEVLVDIAKHNPASVVKAAERLGFDFSEPWLEDVKVLARTRKIDAIKIYRKKTGLGLKESKEAVEALMASDQKGTD